MDKTTLADQVAALSESYDATIAQARRLAAENERLRGLNAELLAALEKIAEPDGVVRHGGIAGEYKEIARAAIAKTEGDAP